MSYRPTAPALMSPPFTLGGPRIVSPDEDDYHGSNYTFNNYAKESPLGQPNYDDNDEDIDGTYPR